MGTNDLMEFAKETEEISKEKDRWKIMVLDPDEEMHHQIDLHLSDCSFKGKSFAPLHAYSYKEALSIIEQSTDIAIIFLNGIEDQEEGLRFVKKIRDEFKNQKTRFVILINENYTQTKKKFSDYDINAFVFKSELNAYYLLNLTTLCIRNYNALLDIEKSQKEMSKITKATSRFVPKMFLKLLSKKNISDVKLGDHIEKKISVLFLDIRSFTSLSEFESPVETFSFINDCLHYIEPVIVKWNGFIDKHIGDALMAIFPESADDAVKASIEMLKVLEEFNYKRIISAQVPIRIGIGINTGTTALGVIGYQDRTECTVIGDVVNAAERIEKATKTFGCNLLISEATFLSLKDPQHYQYRHLGKVHVSGKKQLIKLYEIFDADPEELISFKNSSRIRFEKMLKLCEKGEYLQAKKIAETLHQENKHDLASRHFIREITTTLAKKAYKEE